MRGLVESMMKTLLLSDSCWLLLRDGSEVI